MMNKKIVVIFQKDKMKNAEINNRMNHNKKIKRIFNIFYEKLF